MTDPFAVVTIVSLAGLCVVLGVSVRQRNAPAVVNTLVSLAVVALPFAIASAASALDRAVAFGSVLPAWLAVAGLLHSFGMVGPYDRIAWWDSLTHTVSAALVAALLYAAVLVSTAQAGVADSRPAVGAITVALTLLAGGFWELIELVARELGEATGLEPVLVHYGRRDTIEDLGFDVLGAALVVVFDVQQFVALAASAPALTTQILLGTVGVLAVGSVGLAALARRLSGQRPA